MDITNQSEYMSAYKMHNGFIILKVGDTIQGDFIQKILAIVPNFKGTVIKITDDNAEEEEITLNVSVIASFGKKTAFTSTQKLEVIEGEVHLYTSDGGSSSRAALQMVRDLAPGGLTKAESKALINGSTAGNLIEYNSTEFKVLKFKEKIILDSNKYHSITVCVIKGEGLFKNNETGEEIIMPEGYSTTINASSLLLNSFTIAGTFDPSYISIILNS